MDGSRIRFFESITTKMHPKDISIADFTYHLPEERIAAFPSAERDSTKLLLYKDGSIAEDIYKNIAAHIPAGSLLVFNNTKVIQARILFQKPSGGAIEIFCLEPYEANNEYNVVMGKKEKVKWKCMIGGASKWKSGALVKRLATSTSASNGVKQCSMEAVLVEKLPDAYVVELSWQPVAYTFAKILGMFGDMPLPPYIKRKAEEADKQRYQTIYAKHEGSVAAPTAGLHFTNHIFTTLAAKKISKTYVTLHVGAGTFKPVNATHLQGHKMHSEWIAVNNDTIMELLDKIDNGIIAVGTTSLRTIESLYWMGVKIILDPAIKTNDLIIHQWDVYEQPLANTNYTAKESLQSLLQWMESNNSRQLLTTTQILIAPGYRYKMARAIITNFHQPQSTLLLLVAAAVGNDWKKIYQYALENDFRFLSYGDGSLIFTAPGSAG